MKLIRFFLFYFCLCNVLIIGNTLNQEMSIDEKPIMVIIPSYNNKRWAERNIKSVLEQQYENFEVIYINDCSTDNTLSIIKKMVAQSDKSDRVTIIDNKERHGALYNLYHAIHFCQDDWIVVTLDGDDWFKNEHVLARINQEYTDPEVWMTYGQFEFWPSQEVGYCSKIPEHMANDVKLLRKACGVATHPRTFYAGLFKKIKLEDLLYKGEFFSVTWDRAFMAPMLEMASPNHFRFIPDILYCYNFTNPISDHRVHGVFQAFIRDLIFSKKPYEPLGSAPHKKG